MVIYLQALKEFLGKTMIVLEYLVLSRLGYNVLTQVVEYENPMRPELLQSIKFYHSKETFGDLDILINSNWLKTDYIETIVKIFGLGHGEWSKNGNVLSFKFMNFQIDLIVTSQEEFKTSVDYFAWNDLGNLIGRIAHKHGVKFGHRGSSIIMRDGDYQIGEILITTDTKQIFEYLDLDYQQWQSGFETMVDAYKWIVNSKYFNKAIYALENRNHYARTRDKKRVNYSNFLDWVETIDGLNEYPYEDLTEKSGYNIRQPFFDNICLKFPHVRTEYENILEKHQKAKDFKATFNGDIVKEITGLVDKELGQFMSWCRKEFDLSESLKHTYTYLYNDYTRGLIIKSLKFHYDNNWKWGNIPFEDAKNLVRGIDKNLI